MKPPPVSRWRCTFCDVDHPVEKYSKAGRLRAFCPGRTAYVYGKDSSTAFVPEFVRAKRKYDHRALEELRQASKHIVKAAAYERIRGILDTERRMHAIDMMKKIARYLSAQAVRLEIPPRQVLR